MPLAALLKSAEAALTLAACLWAGTKAHLWSVISCKVRVAAWVQGWGQGVQLGQGRVPVSGCQRVCRWVPLVVVQLLLSAKSGEDRRSSPLSNSAMIPRGSPSPFCGAKQATLPHHFASPCLGFEF